MSDPQSEQKSEEKTEAKSPFEVFTVAGDQLLKTVQKIVEEGTARHITVKDSAGRVIVDVPLTLGVFGMVLAPTLAVVGTAAALATGYTIEVKRTVEPKPQTPDSPTPSA